MLDDIITLNKNDQLTKRLYAAKRIIYVKDKEKIKHFFLKENEIKNLNKIKTLFIYPVKSAFSIKALILLFFNNEIDNKLESIINIIEVEPVSKIA